MRNLTPAQCRKMPLPMIFAAIRGVLGPADNPREMDSQEIADALGFRTIPERSMVSEAILELIAQGELVGMGAPRGGGGLVRVSLPREPGQ